jgi:uncharacterized membrane protein
MKLFCCTVVMVALFSTHAVLSASSAPKVDPQTGKIRTLFIGDPFMQPGFPTPALVEDPKIDLTRIESELGYMVIVGQANPVATMQRFLRLYMPRSESSLIDNYDAIIITAIRSDDVRMEFQRWVKAGVEQHGFGLLMSDDPVSFGACPTVWTPLTGSPWDPTPVGSVLPVYQTEHVSKRDHLFRILPSQPNPVTDGLPWEKSPLIWNHNRPRAKDGAKVLAVTSDETVAADPKNEPVLVYWDIENGRTMAFVWDWGGNGVTGLYLWEYWKDFMTRLVYFIARAAIPPDVSLTHTLRGKMSQYSLEKGMVLSLIDFADTFGANTHQLGAKLGEADALRQGVDRLWIEEDFQACLPAMDEALDSLEAVMEEAVNAKDRALLWVYIIEWLTVLGTSAIVGTILWSLMIRRRLYRQVATTRFEA